MTRLSVVFLAEPPEIDAPLNADFALTHQWELGERGLKSQGWELYLKTAEEDPLVHFTLSGNPIHSNDLIGQYSPEEDHEFLVRGESIEQFGPVYLDQDESGEAKIHRMSDVFVDIEFNSPQMHKRMLFAREDPDVNLWVVKGVI